MRVSTKGRYALRMMIEFGLNPDQCTKISQVAARQGISDKYLEQIVSLLHKAGYVRSIRGAQGGYMLTRKPEEYTVGMILKEALLRSPAWMKTSTIVNTPDAAPPLLSGSG